MLFKFYTKTIEIVKSYTSKYNYMNFNRLKKIFITYKFKKIVIFE